MYLEIPAWVLCFAQWLCNGDYYDDGHWAFRGRAIGPLLLQEIFLSAGGQFHYFSAFLRSRICVPIHIPTPFFQILVENSRHYLKTPTWVWDLVIRLCDGERFFPARGWGSHMRHIGLCSLIVNHVGPHHFLALRTERRERLLAHFMEE